MGTPANLSKRGVAVAPSRQQNYVREVRQAVEPTIDAMVTKRTEWLEHQERRLTANLHEHKNEHGETKQKVDAVESQAMQLFHDTQWLYGRTEHELFGIEAEDGQVYAALQKYRASDTKEVTSLAPTDRWVLLSYPMEEVEDAQGNTHVLMKMRKVDARTGQLSLCWAIVATRTQAGCDYTIGEFSVVPV